MITITFSTDWKAESLIYVHNVPKEDIEKWAKLFEREIDVYEGFVMLNVPVGKTTLKLFS